MTDDTAVSDAIHLDPDSEEKDCVGQMGTRGATGRGRLENDAESLPFCSREWINSAAYVEIELVRKFPLMVAL